MSEIIKKMIDENTGKQLIFHLSNGFRFQGTVTQRDDDFVEFFDEIKKRPKAIRLDKIDEVEIVNDNKGVYRP